MSENQQHTFKATGNTPLMVVFLLDTSGSMAEPLLESEGKRKIDMVMEAYQACLKVLLRRSTKGEIVSPRYAIHLFAYNTKVLDVYEETLSIGAIPSPKNLAVRE